MNVCPNCGVELQPVDLGPDTAPWLCADCARGWWQAELDAASSWRNVERDFGDASQDVVAACEVERAERAAGDGA